jgi:phosphohistidine swiveling domain-containing protein
MNRIILVLVCLVIIGNTAFAQKNKNKKNTLKVPANEVIVTDKYAKFMLEETEHDFGVINENGGLAIYNFSIKNTGNIPLIIQDVQPECGCTKTEWTTQPIAPGSIGNIKAVFNPAGRPGYFRKNITLFTNTEVVKTVLHLKGNVAPAKYEFSSTYTYQYGFLAVNNNTFKFNVKQGKSDSTYLKIYNLRPYRFICFSCSFRKI